MPVNVVFLEPAFPSNQRDFVRALHAVGARVIGIGERPLEALGDELRSQMVHYEQVSNVTSTAQVERVVKALQRKVPIHQLESTIEAHVMCAAKVREACGLPGTSVKTTYLCRDKPAMKEALRQAGVACAQSIGSSDPEEIRQFANRIGYPLIVKPRDAAGASGTMKCNDAAELEAALRSFGVAAGRSVAIEEFIEGHEGFWDTLTVGGRVIHEFVSHYYPNVLDAMRHRWINPQFIATNRIDAVSGYDELKRMGRKVLGALGIESSPTHMEWFAGPKGLKFSEIGCRPPGVRAWDLYATGNDIDIYREWAMTMVHGRASQPLSRRMSAGIVALRPSQDGRIVDYRGLGDIERAFGQWIIDVHLPSPGTPTQPVDAGYMANAYIRMKHPDYDELRRMLDLTGRTVKVLAR